MSMVQAPSLKQDDFFKIMFKHVPTMRTVNFEGWVTSFSDQFTSNWSPQNVYGRMDPLVAFEGTQRVISMDFDVVSANFLDAKSNLVAISELIKFQYPMYSEGSRAAQNTLKAAPLIQMKWTNLLSNAPDGQMLTGYMNGVTYAPDVNEGGFLMTTDATSNEIVKLGKDSNARTGTPLQSAPATTEAPKPTPADRRRATANGGRMYVPKKVSLSITFNVLHTHLTGWENNKVFGNQFVDPYFPNTSMTEMEDALAALQSRAPGEEEQETLTAAEKANDADVLKKMGGKD